MIPLSHQKAFIAICWGLLLLLGATPGEAASPRRGIAVLETTDSSGFNVANKIQTQLADRFFKTELFSVVAHPLTLRGYTTEDLAPVYDRTNSELMSFAYVDRERVAVFLFDINRPGRYVATSESLSGSPGNRVTELWIETQVGKAFTQLMRQYSVAAFDEVPNVKAESTASIERELTPEEKGRRLFMELSNVQEGAFYVGANVGMARFAASGASASVVNFGGYGGVKLYDPIRLEIGFDIFTYLFLHADARVRLPIAEKYLSLALGLGINHVTAVFTQNRGFNPTFIRTNQFLYGPSLSIDIPLLGASLRGDLRVLLGDATVILGTYGLAYSL